MKDMSIALTICAFFSAQAGQVDAAEIKTRLVAKDIQTAEEIIAVAIASGDHAELKRQADRLLMMGSRIEDTEEAEARVSCAGSAGTLRNIAEDLSRPGQARSIVSARRNINLYRETMPMCEAEVGLKPPAGANLRTN